MNTLLQFSRDSLPASSPDAMPPDLCATRHPIILLHGIAFRDNMIFSSWGHVPDFLRRGGALVFLGGLGAWNSYIQNAQSLKTRIAEVLVETGARKVNLIAHSKGGLDARYMISRLGMGDKVASLTTVSTPHRGSAFADVATKLTPDEHGLAYGIVDLLGKLMGDKGPQSALAIAELTRANMEKFNAETPDAEGVHYQSFGTRMTSLLDDPLFVPSYEIVKKYEGENDGMVSVSSCQWGNFRGILEGHGSGISHLQITGAVRDVVSGINIPMWYVGMVQDLKVQGY